MKILINSSAEILASKGIPVTMYSCSVLTRSTDTNAPILRGLMYSTDLTKACIICSSELIGVVEKKSVARPNRSKPVRISGEKITTAAITPYVIN